MNAKTGIWSALGAVLGGAIGATTGHYVAQARPRHRYGGGGRPSSSEVEDAMVIGGASGAVFGAFIAGAAAGEEPSQPPPRLPGK